MAHEIEFNKLKRTHSFFAVAERAWHGLGTIVDKALTSEEAIKIANLDYTVDKFSNYIKVGNDEIKCPNSYSTIRTDTNTILGDKLTKDYEIVQNTEAFAFF